MSKSISLLSALICTFIWGTTFIAQDTGMELIGPYVFNGIRFFVGLLALVPFFLIFESKKIIQEINKDKKYFVVNTFLVGLFLFGGTVFQQIALLYTDVANAAFFTIFYVPMVPIIIFFLYKFPIHWSIWPSVVICVVGGYFLTDFYDSTVRLGDLLVIIGALFWSLHIIFIGKIVQKFDIPIFVGIIQTFIVSFFSIILALIFLDFALDISFLFEFIIDRELVFKY